MVFLAGVGKALATGVGRVQRWQQFWAAVLTSAPQPVGAVAAYLLVERPGIAVMQLPAGDRRCLNLYGAGRQTLTRSPSSPGAAATTAALKGEAATAYLAGAGSGATWARARRRPPARRRPVAGRTRTAGDARRRSEPRGVDATALQP